MLINFHLENNCILSFMNNFFHKGEVFTDGFSHLSQLRF